jgi:hypothetical protein
MKWRPSPWGGETRMAGSYERVKANAGDHCRPRLLGPGRGGLFDPGPGGVPSGARAQAQKTEVRNLGISRLGERTMVTVLLDRAADPRVSPYMGQGRSQLIVEFPQAWAGKLPDTLAGDEVLVKQVRNEVSEAGVKIILEMFPERPYIWKREMTPLSGGRAMFRLTCGPIRRPRPQGRPPPAAAAAAPGAPGARRLRPPPRRRLPNRALMTRPGRNRLRRRRSPGAGPRHAPQRALCRVV